MGNLRLKSSKTWNVVLLFNLISLQSHKLYLDFTTGNENICLDNACIYHKMSTSLNFALVLEP